MSNSILILGESGTGKSTSIRHLDPTSTFILNVIGKPLPFRGATKNYTKLSKDGREGNYYCSDNRDAIMRVINLVNDKRLDINCLIIDDFGYTITNSFMRKASQKGYDKYNEIGSDAFYMLDLVANLREDLYCVVMMHSEIDTHGKYKPKTIGKMIDQYVCIEGKFTHVFHSLITDSGYKFTTNNDGQHMSKTPLGMFPDLLIDNDLKSIIETMNNYYNNEELI